MQTKSIEPGPAVFHVADDRMSDVSEMNSELVCPARYRFEFEECGFGAPLANPITGQRVFSVVLDRPQTKFGESADRCIDHARIVRGTSRNNGEISLFYLFLLKMPGEYPVGTKVLGEYDNAGSVLIEPVDESRAPEIVEFIRIEMMRDGVEQRAGPDADGRVDKHTRRLVHDQKIVIFKKHIELNVFRMKRGTIGTIDVDLDKIVRLKYISPVPVFPVDLAFGVADEFAKIHPPEVRKLRVKKLVEP